MIATTNWLIVHFSKIEPLKQVLAGDDTFDLAVGWMQNNQVTKMHVPEEIEALLEVVSCDHSVWIFNHIWSEIDESILEHFVIPDLFLVEFEVDRAAIKTTTKHLPWQNFVLWSLRKLFDVKMTLVINPSSRFPKTLYLNSLIFKWLASILLDLRIVFLPVGSLLHHINLFFAIVQGCAHVWNLGGLEIFTRIIYIDLKSRLELPLFHLVKLEVPEEDDNVISWDKSSNIPFNI